MDIVELRISVSAEPRTCERFSEPIEALVFALGIHGAFSLMGRQASESRLMAAQLMHSHRCKLGINWAKKTDVRNHEIEEEYGYGVQSTGLVPLPFKFELGKVHQPNGKLCLSSLHMCSHGRSIYL